MSKRSRPTGKSPPQSAPTPGAPRRQKGDVELALLAVITAVWAGAAWLTPLLVTAPLAFFLAKGAAANPQDRERLFRRWSITVLVMFTAAAAFAPSRTLQSVPFSIDIPVRIDAWLAGDAGPPLGARYMFAVAVAYLVGTTLSAGVVGALVFSSVLAINGTYATCLVSKGYNVLQMALVAVSPWQWCFLVGMVVLFTPLSVFSRSRVLARDAEAFRWDDYRKRVYLGAGLIAAAFVLRFVIAGVYGTIVRGWTI
jgi:hypothetical protein